MKLEGWKSEYIWKFIKDGKVVKTIKVKGGKFIDNGEDLVSELKIRG